MGTKIDMVAVSRPIFRFTSRGSIYLSVRAARKCLRDAGIDPCDIGLLVNSGVYRFKNTGEPAIAALIQNKIGANPVKKITRGRNSDQFKNTFSFDVNNGGCGWLTAIQIVDGFIQTGDILYGMVVTGDSEPFRGLSENYNFESAAAAIILSKSEDYKGFSLFRSYSYSDHNNELISNTSFSHKVGKWGKRNILNVSQKETYLELCVECATEALNKFFDEAGITFDDTDLIISSQSPVGFTARMKNRIGLNNKLVETDKTGNKGIHTAGPAFALKKVFDNNRFKTSKKIIFMTVGSGLTVALALYIN